MAQLTILPAFVSFGAASSLTMTETEMKLIDESPEVMRVDKEGEPIESNST